MLILAVVLTGFPAEKPSRLDYQLMTSPAYNEFADRADAICPARRLRYIHPADLDGIEEGFMPSLTRRKRHQVNSLNIKSKVCMGEGASCPAQHTLAAISGAGMIEAFVSFACTSAI